MVSKNISLSNADVHRKARFLRVQSDLRSACVIRAERVVRGLRVTARHLRGAGNSGSFAGMSTLAEIESAAADLSPTEKAELLLFVAGQLRAAGAPLPEPRLFSPEQITAWMDEDEEDMRKFRAGE